MMSVVLRKYIPLVIVGVLGFFTIFSFPLDIKVFTDTSTQLGSWVMLLASFALGIGVINLFIVHGHPIMKKDKEKWPYSAALLLSLIIVFLIGIVDSVTGPSYKFLYDVIIGAGLLTLTALRGFFMFSAFTRAYKARNLEGGVMLLATLFVMMYQVPIFDSFLPQMSEFTKWMLDVPFVGVTRGFAMIAGIAMTIMAFKMLSGMDKSWMGREE